jgi:hypothetical protein
MGRRKPSGRQAVHPLPVQAMALAAVSKGRTPMPGCLGPECSDRPTVAWDGVVGEVPSHDACQPLSLHWDGLVPTSLQFGLDLFELRRHSLRAGDAFQHEPSALRLRTDMREAEELERLRLAETTCCSITGGEPSELDQTCLVWVQLQIELRKPLTKVPEEPLRITKTLEPTDKVVGLCRVPDYAEDHWDGLRLSC